MTQYLTHLATHRRVSASTQNQAFSALLFLYRDVLGREISGLAATVRAKRPGRVPLVLTRQEVESVLGQLRGVPHLMASLMYPRPPDCEGAASGLRRHRVSHNHAILQELLELPLAYLVYPAM